MHGWLPGPPMDCDIGRKEEFLFSTVIGRGKVTSRRSGAAKRRGEKLNVILALVGDFGDRLFDYYGRVRDEKGERVPFPMLPPDLVICDSRVLEKAPPRAA